MTTQQALLTRLVEEQYALVAARLTPIAHYHFDDRGIYRVALAGGRSYVLRAFCWDAREALLGQVAVLDYLEQHGYPAPRVMRTPRGRAVATYEGWTALLLSYVEGTEAAFSSRHLELLGARAGRLHALTGTVLAEAGAAGLPNSRLRPAIGAQQTDAQRARGREALSRAHWAIYDGLVATLERVAQAAGNLPVTVLHGDCWPQNAVVTPEGALVLIDWDCAGVGPPVLEVGYLLMACHFRTPQIPAIEPDSALIGAVVRGYCRHRRLTAAELDLLPDAVRYDVARRVVQDEILSAAGGSAQVDLLRQKVIARDAASDAIALLARSHFAAFCS
jgi:Ser/Thr protein kinase RdoA (MazF antagonist)